MTTKLRNCVQILQVFPVSSAACERGFSQMNRPHIHNSGQKPSSSTYYYLSDLLMISFNGLYAYVIGLSTISKLYRGCNLTEVVSPGF